MNFSDDDKEMEIDNRHASIQTDFDHARFEEYGIAIYVYDNQKQIEIITLTVSN